MANKKCVVKREKNKGRWDKDSIPLDDRSSTQGPPGLKSLWAGAMLLLWGSGATGRTHTFASLRLRSPDHSVPSGRLGFFAMWSSGSSHGEACFLLGQPGCACLQRFENLTTCF